MFQAVLSEMWRLRVVNLTVQCYVSGGLVRNVAVAGWVSQSTVLCFRRFGTKCGGCGLGISNYNMFRRFGPKCGGCGLGISPLDLVRKARDRVFHLKCFTCHVCRWVVRQDYIWRIKGLKHEIFDLGVLTPTKFIWLSNLGIGEKSKFSFKFMLLFAILYFKRMLSICQWLSSVCSVYVLRTDRALPIFESI